jgi:uncharacterized protein (DUF305 family)
LDAGLDRRLIDRRPAMRTPFLMAALLLLTACDGGGDPVQQALRDTSSANHAAAAKTTEEAAAVDHAAMGHGPGATPGDRAFAASETEMHQRMGAASGETVDQAYIAKMIEHHRGAVAMAEVALKESRDPEVRRMAQVVVDSQTREIAEMQAWKPAATQ